MVTGLKDTRSQILASAHRRCSLQCEQLGHEFIPDIAAGGDYVCGYCRAARALIPPRAIDKTLETVT